MGRFLYEDAFFWRESAPLAIFKRRFVVLIHFKGCLFHKSKHPALAFHGEE